MGRIENVTRRKHRGALAMARGRVFVLTKGAPQKGSQSVRAVAKRPLPRRAVLVPTWNQIGRAGAPSAAPRCIERRQVSLPVVLGTVPNIAKAGTKANLVTDAIKCAEVGNRRSPLTDRPLPLSSAMVVPLTRACQITPT